MSCEFTEIPADPIPLLLVVNAPGLNNRDLRMTLRAELKELIGDRCSPIAILPPGSSISVVTVPQLTADELLKLRNLIEDSPCTPTN